MADLLFEAVSGVRRFLDGQHQVTYLGKHGNFHVYHAMRYYGHDPESLEGARANFFSKTRLPEVQAHLRKIHTVRDHVDDQKIASNFWKSDAANAHADSADPVNIPGSKPFIHDPLITDSDVLSAFHSATKSMQALGLPSQTRTVVFHNMSGAYNRNTGKSDDVGGYWDKSKHVIGINSASDNLSNSAGLSRLIVHEAAHAMHDEMGSRQKAAWREFYHKHVVNSVLPIGSSADHETFAQRVSHSFAHYLEPRGAARKALHSLHQAVNLDTKDASIFHDERLGERSWYKDAQDTGYLNDGIVVQPHRSVTGVDNAGRKRKIRKLQYSVMRSIDSSRDKSDMDRLIKQHGYRSREQYELHGGDQSHAIVHPISNPDLKHLVPLSSMDDHDFYPSEQKTRNMRHADSLKANDQFKERLAQSAGVSSINDWHTKYSKSTSMVPDHLTSAVAQSVENLKSEHPGVVSGHELSNVYHSDGEFGRELIHSLSRHAMSEVLSRYRGNAKNRTYSSDAIKYEVLQRSRPRLSAEIPDDLVGKQYSSDRDRAYTSGATTRSYGAANDHELLATTAEHLAYPPLHIYGDKEKLSKHRTLTKKFKNLMGNHWVTEGLISRINNALGGVS